MTTQLKSVTRLVEVPLVGKYLRREWFTSEGESVAVEYLLADNEAAVPATFLEDDVAAEVFENV
jgi:hypothetical protein